MYSRNKEDDVVLSYFGNFRGRFLDIGANDGRSASNTYRFAELGWGGLCVEPGWRVVGQLIETHQHHPDVEILNAAIDEQDGISPFWDCQITTLSTMDKDLQDRYPKRKGAKKIHIATCTMTHLLKTFPGPFHYISIDAEGLSIRILRAMPLLEMGAKVICIECFPPHIRKGEDKAILDYCTPFGFKVLAKTKENLILAL